MPPQSLPKVLFLIALLVALSGCCRNQDALLPPCEKTCPRSPYFIVFLVDAKHLDYTSGNGCLGTLAKNPRDNFGHAWIYLEGLVDGETVAIEGGHSGETGSIQAKYFDGVMNGLEYGYANPTPELSQFPRCEPDPIKYLWAVQSDGFFHKGNGGHVPTYAARVDLTQEQFLKVMHYINPCNYDYAQYAITGNQCSSFVSQIGALIDFPIECQVTIPIEQQLWGYKVWEDPCYSKLTISTPDIIEKSLQQSVKDGQATYALPWYRKTHRQ